MDISWVVDATLYFNLGATNQNLMHKALPTSNRYPLCVEVYKKNINRGGHLWWIHCLVGAPGGAWVCPVLRGCLHADPLQKDYGAFPAKNGYHSNASKIFESCLKPLYHYDIVTYLKVLSRHVWTCLSMRSKNYIFVLEILGNMRNKIDNLQQ